MGGFPPNPAPVTPAQTAVSGVEAEDSAKVGALIAAGDSRRAVDFAKSLHERLRNAASEELLVDAYSARIAALFERGLTAEAKALLERIRHRFPAARKRLNPSSFAAADKGDLDSLLQPLNDPALPAEKQAAIYKSLRLHVVDLGALARSGALPAEHPLRVSAAGLLKGLEAVTSGPVRDSELAFPELSRHSPLASWKMLLRAIAAFYRRDDGLCRKCLDSIESGSAAARLAPALLALMGDKCELSPAATELVRQVGRHPESFRARLRKLDQLLHSGNREPILKEIRRVMADCREFFPGLVDDLRRNISARAYFEGLDPRRVNASMDGPAPATAAYWKLLARDAEQDQSTVFSACTLWEEFRKHALSEGLISAKGPEAAAIYLHMESLLNRLRHDSLPGLRRRYTAGFVGLSRFYADQPAEIRAIGKVDGQVDFYFLDPAAVLERACQCDPRAENFRRWWERTHSEAVAAQWRIALPSDAEPLLRLMEAAEKRRAYQKAFKYMKEAEDLDGINPAVRKARLRLLVSIAVDRLRKSQARQAELDIAALEALPHVNQGDRPAFVAALRWVSCFRWGTPEEADRVQDEIRRLLNNSVAAGMLLSSVARQCKLRQPEAAPAPPAAGDGPLPDAVVRVCALAEEMGFAVDISPEISARIAAELRGKKGAVTEGLGSIGEAAFRAGDLALAYAVSAAGLLSGVPATQAQFLFLRARTLLARDPDRHETCLAAAFCLARRNREPELLDKIGLWREHLESSSFDPTAEFANDLSPDTIGKILDWESRQQVFPSAAKAPERPARRRCDCPGCRMERGEIPPELGDMVERFGEEAVARALEEVLDGPDKPGSGKGGKRRGRAERGPSDFDVFLDRL